MFTGIVTDVGEVVSAQMKDRWLHVFVRAPKTIEGVSLGSSVCVSGVCLTVAGIFEDVMEFVVMPETISKTVIGQWSGGAHVNLEQSLRVGDELGGHFVYGHVDGVGSIEKIERDNESVLMTVLLPRELMQYTASKGSIALDGVSLTIADLSDGTITVALVEYTLAHTSLGEKRIYDRFNVECDMLLKFLFKLNASSVDLFQHQVPKTRER